jgi:hypothetical protein
MKKHVAWVGAVAVVAALGFSGYAVADAPDVGARNLGVSGWTQLGGPIIFQSPNYTLNGGPAGVGFIFAGHSCSTTKLDGASTDGSVSGPDIERNMAYVTLGDIYPGLYVTGTQFIPDANYSTGKLRVCVNKKPTTNVIFNYLILNVGWDTGQG